MSQKFSMLQLILFFLTFIFYSYITDSYAESIPIVKELQQSYQSIKNFSATFTQELTHQESGSKETRIGKLFFKKPLLVRWETNTPHEELLLINTNAVWDYLPDENLVYKYSTDIVKDSNPLEIYCKIIVEKESQKSIVIGSKGKMIKKIGIRARHDIEYMMGRHIDLKLLVQVVENWRNSNKFLNKTWFRE